MARNFVTVNVRIKTYQRMKTYCTENEHIESGFVSKAVDKLLDELESTTNSDQSSDQKPTS